MILAVFDCNVLISAIGWAGNPRACIELVAAGQVKLCLTEEVWAECEQRVPEVLSVKRPGVDPRPLLNELLRTSYFVMAAPLGRQRSRDLKDDSYLACALGAGAGFVVTSDRDLLDLGKPFGIRVESASIHPDTDDFKRQPATDLERLFQSDVSRAIQHQPKRRRLA